ncbi:MAG: zinc metalloprotease HtpX [Magnetospirillum sp.]|nr:zinc metalloprotease HtpX [Magnetospirillum sp.]
MTPFAAARLDAAVLARQHRRNMLRSLAVLGGIGAWMALVGWLVAGGAGILWAVLGAVLVLLIQPIRSTTLLAALYGAVPVDPAQAPGLYSMGAELARRAGLAEVPPLLFIPRNELIALSTGWGREGAVAVSDGLLRALGGRELAAVLAHETSHLRAGDLKLLRLAEAAGRLTRTLALFGLVMILLYLPAEEVMGGVPVAALLLLVLAPLVSDLLGLTLSRTREFEADRGAVELTGDPDGLISALMRIDTLQEGGWERLRRRGRKGWLQLIRTHPTTEERVERLRELAPAPPPRWLALPEVLVMPGLMGMAPSRRPWWRRHR